MVALPSPIEVLVRLISQWLNSDRIRISPRCGELLRLQPPAVVVIQGVPWRLEQRSVQSREDAIWVRYDGTDGQRSGHLLVSPRGDVVPPRVVLVDDETRVELAQSDIVVYG